MSENLVVLDRSDPGQHHQQCRANHEQVERDNSPDSPEIELERLGQGQRRRLAQQHAHYVPGDHKESAIFVY